MSCSCAPSHDLRPRPSSPSRGSTASEQRRYLLRDLMVAHMGAQRAAAARAALARQGMLRAARLLWAAPALLLRIPMVVQEATLEGACAQVGAKGAERANEVRRRLQLAEAGAWVELLTEYLAEVDAAEEAQRARSCEKPPSSMPLQPEPDEAVFTRAASRTLGHVLCSAADALLGSVQAPLIEATAQEVDLLVADPLPHSELDAQKLETTVGFKQAPMVEPIWHKHIRRRLRVPKTSARPGPSCWRNSYLARIGDVRGGVAALARWSTLWAKGNITSEVAELWTAAIVVPVDRGQAKVGPVEAPRRKLRPIACAEAPVKLAEGTLIDGMLPELARVVEPRQVGCGMADGAGIVVSLVRSWAADIVRTTPRT